MTHASDATAEMLGQLEAKIADARDPFPAADLNSADCRWCGIAKYLDGNGAVRCAHCDAGHDTQTCGICRTILKRPA